MKAQQGDNLFMKTLSQKDSEKRRADGVRAAYQRLLQEARHLGWQILLVGSGFWLVAVVCIERFVAAYAEALERQGPGPESVRAGRWDNHLVGEMRGKLVHAARWCEQRAKGWQRRAEQIDTALLKRRA